MPEESAALSRKRREPVQCRAGDAGRARTHQALYRRLKADESAQAITGPYRQLHPHDNNERQAVHEHRQTVPATREYEETR